MPSEEHIDYLREKYNVPESIESRDWKLPKTVRAVEEDVLAYLDRFFRFYEKRFTDYHEDLIDFIGSYYIPDDNWDEFELQRCWAAEYEDYFNSYDYIDYRSLPIYQQAPFHGKEHNEIQVAKDIYNYTHLDFVNKYNLDRLNPDVSLFYYEFGASYRYLIYLWISGFNHSAFQIEYRPFDTRYIFIDYKARFGSRIRSVTHIQMHSILRRHYMESKGKLHDKTLF